MNKIEQHLEKNETVFISITGLKLKGFWHILSFFKLAIPSFNQARAAKGNLLTEVKTIDGIRHTLSVWDSKRSMTRFLYTGPHKRAIERFDKIATGKTYGYDSKSVPSWDEALVIYHDKAKDYSKAETT